MAVDNGRRGLMAYGPTFAELEERVASFVQRILNGAKPDHAMVSSKFGWSST
jgi:hypothetical protein